MLIRKSFFILLTAGALVAGCGEPESPTPIPASGPTTTAPARFLFVNAAPGAPQLNFFVNNVQSDTNRAFAAAQAVYVPSQTGRVQLRAKAATGQIGGTLAAADVLFRGGATNQDNFTAAANTRYTVFVADTIRRPAPLRVVDGTGRADTTVVALDGRTPAVLRDDDARAQSRGPLARIGVVPPGNSDPGGVRFYVVTDVFPTLTATQAAARFVHLSPNAPAVWVQAVPAAGAPVTLAGNVQYALSNGGGFNPAVGSRSATVAFTAVTADTYTIEVRTGSATGPVALSVPNVRLAAGKIYTFFANGLAGSTATPLGAGVVLHN